MIHWFMIYVFLWFLYQFFMISVPVLYQFFAHDIYKQSFSFSPANVPISISLFTTLNILSSGAFHNCASRRRSGNEKKMETNDDLQIFSIPELCIVVFTEKKQEWRNEWMMTQRNEAEGGSGSWSIRKQYWSRNWSRDWSLKVQQNKNEIRN